MRPGAGTSAYVGIGSAAQEVHDERHWNFQSIATTDIVAHPQAYLKRGPDGLVSFAQVAIRQKDVATVRWPKDLVDELYRHHYYYTKEENGFLQAHGDEAQSLASQPKETNDAGFAMTSNYLHALDSSLGL